MALKIQSTKITETPKGFVVEMILSSAADLEAASDVVQLRATLDTESRAPRLPELQEVVLRHVRDGLNEEIHRFQSLPGHKT
jgi:hypothetical protein